MLARHISFAGAAALALAMLTNPARAQEPAPWESGAAPAAEGGDQAQADQQPAAQPEAAPAPAPAPAASDEGAADLGDEATGEVPPVGKIGIGYFSTSAPLGVRMWLTDKIGFDAGLGLSIDSSTPDVAWGLSAEGGILYALATFKNLTVFGRGGVGIGVNDNGTPGADVTYDVVVNGLLGAELFMTALGFPNLSFTAGIGLQIDLTNQSGDFGIQIASAQAPVNLVASAVLGFHIYL